MIQPKKYRKQPVVIEAMLLTLESAEDVALWARASYDYTRGDLGTWRFVVPTLEGAMQGNLGDYIIKGLKGEFYPCKPDISEASYVEVES
jgi:hypothetical protein